MDTVQLAATILSADVPGIGGPDAFKRRYSARNPLRRYSRGYRGALLHYMATFLPLTAHQLHRPSRTTPRVPPLGAWCESQPQARARDFLSDQGAEPQAYWSISRILQRRAGGKDPLSARSEFYTRLLGIWLDRVARAHQQLMPYFERRGAPLLEHVLRGAPAEPTVKRPRHSALQGRTWPEKGSLDYQSRSGSCWTSIPLSIRG